MADGSAWSSTEARRRLGIYLAVALGAVGFYTVLYRWTLATFEGISVGWIEAMHVVVETFTTTGYGEDAGLWNAPPTFLLSMAMQFTGVALIFTTLPLFVVPLVERALERDPPTESSLTDHVIVTPLTAHGEILISELRSKDIPHLVIEPDRERARELRDDYEVVHGDPESVADLRAANADAAVALVADSDDRTNASVILTAEQLDADVRLVSLVEEPEVADYHRYAGADDVVSPRQLLGESLARKAASPINPESEEAVLIGDDFEVAEVLIHPDSELEGRTIADGEIGRRTGADIIGIWSRGEFVTPPSPATVLDERTTLLVTGHEDQVARLRELARSEARRHRRGRVVVAGYGEVGSTAADALADAGVPHVVLDSAEKPGVDVVGDVTDPEALERAGVADAESVLIALDDDTTAIFATLVVERLAPEAEIIVRANDAASVKKIYRAGAEYVLALSTVSGRMLASNLTDEEVIAPQSQIEIVRVDAPRLVGTSLAKADVRARTGSTVLAVERDDELRTDVGPDFRIRSGDTLVVAGTDEAVNAFNERYG
ncbi:potassium channel family protein [Halobellus sp. EA9]|uniref:potassium channel family protein n=1 Tax=Halobellus sp. EA9 TaxID=3421647 RepID=UPI003EBFE7F7